MIRVDILSKSNAKSESYRLDCKTAVISINNVGDRTPKFFVSDNLIGVLPLTFDDVKSTEEFCMTENDGRLIKEFLSLVLPKIDRLIIHCEFGVSRSSGITAAILKALTGNDTDVFDNAKYVPNMLCYRITLNSLLNGEGESFLGQYDMRLQNDC